MKRWLTFILNLPWTLLGLYQALLCDIQDYRCSKGIFVFSVNKFKSLPILINMLLAGFAFLIAGNNTLATLMSGFAFAASFELLFMVMPGMVGLTRGHTILIKKENFKDKTILRHEEIHVEQGDRYFGFLPVLYIFEFLKEGLKILWQGVILFPKAGYWNNKFEKEAYKRANQTIADEETGK